MSIAQGELLDYENEQYILDDYDFNDIAPLTSTERGILYDLPEGFLTSQDGYIVFSLIFPTEKGEQFLLVLREDGKKVGNW